MFVRKQNHSYLFPKLCPKKHCAGGLWSFRGPQRIIPIALRDSFQFLCAGTFVFNFCQWICCQSTEWSERKLLTIDFWRIDHQNCREKRSCGIFGFWTCPDSQGFAPKQPVDEIYDLDGLVPGKNTLSVDTFGERTKKLLEIIIHQQGRAKMTEKKVGEGESMYSAFYGRLGRWHSGWSVCVPDFSNQGQQLGTAQGGKSASRQIFPRFLPSSISVQPRTPQNFSCACGALFYFYLACIHPNTKNSGRLRRLIVENCLYTPRNWKKLRAVGAKFLLSWVFSVREMHCTPLKTEIFWPPEAALAQNPRSQDLSSS